VLYSEHGFLMYGLAPKTTGATPVTAPEGPDLKADISALLASVTPRTKVLLIANPNNPTGSMLTREEVARLASRSATARVAGAGCRLCRICDGECL
jgi:histidinol-phosphate aminotransferase